MDELLKAIALLFESKMKVYTEKTVSAWYDLLKPYPPKHVLTAINESIHNNDDFISVGKLVKLMPSKISLEKALDVYVLKNYKETFENGIRDSNSTDLRTSFRKQHEGIEQDYYSNGDIMPSNGLAIKEMK